jgi:phytoene dehydrogenase-like protein
MTGVTTGHTEERKIVIVGAGVAGLCCALELQAAGLSCLVLEASDVPGGRVRTDRVDGFLLDRGFQVLLTAYPEVRRVLDLPALRLGTFAPGALVWTGGKLHRVADPFRQPWALPATLLAKVGSFTDKLNIARLRREVCAGSLDDLLARPETTTLEALRQRYGFSERMIDTFFRPFLGGIFLERELATSSRMLDFVFRMFSLGRAALPAAGMGAIPAQLVARLTAKSGAGAATLRLGTQVAALEDGGVRLASGQRITAAAVVLATAAGDATHLLPGLNTPLSRMTACVYYSATQPPPVGRFLVLNGEASGPVNNLCVPSNVKRGYAPAGKALIAASVLGTEAELTDPGLEAAVRRQLTTWFGAAVAGWRHLRTDLVRDALPARRSLEPADLPARCRPGLYLCGDHRTTPSLQGAMASGRRAAEAIREAL